MVIRSVSVSSLPFVVLACSAPEVGADTIGLEFIHDRITSLGTDAQGDSWIGFGSMARLFAILKPDQQMLAFAKAAHASGQAVHATVRAGHAPKTSAALQQPIDPRRVAVVRLAVDPDPRAR